MTIRPSFNLQKQKMTPKKNPPYLNGDPRDQGDKTGIYRIDCPEEGKE